MKSRLSLIYIIIFAFPGILFLSSCNRHNYRSQSKADRQKAEQLSRKMGIAVSTKDDLFLYEEAASWLGTPYRYGGTSRGGVDCSGFTGNIYRKVYRVKLHRSVNDIYTKDIEKVRRGQLREGDLVFFKLSGKRKPSHMGIYLKDGYFIHASTSKGVMISSLNSDYYRKSFVSGGRVTGIRR